MAKISNTVAYPGISDLKGADYLVITDADNNLMTKTVTINQVQALFGIDTLIAKVTINSAALLSLGDTDATLIPAPGAGKVIDTMRVSYFVDAGSQVYDFANILLTSVSGVNIDQNEINSAVDVLKSKTTSNLTLTENTAVTLSTATNPTQGTGELYFNIIYRVLNVGSSF